MSTAFTLPRPNGFWPTWRLHRLSLLATAAVLVTVVVGLVYTGAKIRAAATGLGLDHCGSACTNDQLEAFATQASEWGSWTQYLALLPGLLGMFIGAPLLAREYETGTYRFAWTQEITPLRLLLTKFFLLGGATTGAALALDAYFHWWFTPLADHVRDRITPWSYQNDGVYLAAATLFAVSAGVLAGALLRRTVPAMLATCVFWFATFLFDWRVLRPRLAPPLTVESTDKSGPGPANWVLHWSVADPAGHRLTDAQLNALTADHPHNFSAWLRTQGYTTWAQYEPANRFWHLQLLDASLLVTGAIVFAALTLWWLRRHPT